MPARYTLRLQFSPEEDPGRVTEELLGLVKSARVDEIMFFYFAEALNDGHDSLARVQEWADGSRPYRQALETAGVTVSLNPWHSLLHTDRYRRLKVDQVWQTMVDPNGRAADACVCPLDESWRAYFEQTLHIYGREGFRAVWLDDDIRLHNHWPLDWGGCFCPLHMAEFEKRKGIRTTRAQVVRRCTAPGEPHPWREAWLDMWDETQTELVAHWRDVLAGYGVELGLMTSVAEHHSAEGRRWKKWWKAIGGDRPPVHRPHFWPYEDIRPAQLPESIARMDQNRCMQPAEVENGPEVDLGYQAFAWHRSYRQVGAEISLALIHGANNLNISAYEMLGNHLTDHAGAGQFLAQWRPTFDWLADRFPMTFQPVGVGLPWSEDMARRMHTRAGGRWDALLCPSRGWSHWLGPLGYSFTMRAAPHINALAGPIAWTYSADEIRQWLSGSVLLDGDAAAILVERGLGDLIGLKSARFITQTEVLYALECCTDAEFGLRVGGRMIIDDRPHAVRLLQGVLAEEAREVSELVNPLIQRVGHGLVLFENVSGGRIAIVPWLVHTGGHGDVISQSTGVHVEMTSNRHGQMTRVLNWLNRDGQCGRVEGGAWLMPQFFTDGQQWRGVVWNAGLDAVEKLTVHLPAAMPPPKSVIQIDAQGRRHDAKLSGDQLTLTRPLHQWEFVVLC